MELLTNAFAEGILPAIIIVVYLVVVKILDIKKETKKIKLNNELIESINEIGKFVGNITKNILDNDSVKCKIAIKDSFSTLELKITSFFINTLITNHLEIDKEIVVMNVHNISNSEYYAVYNTLSFYVSKGKNVSEYMKESWIKEISDCIELSLFEHNDNKEHKIALFSKRINILLQTYITYLSNKI